MIPAVQNHAHGEDFPSAVVSSADFQIHYGDLKLSEALELLAAPRPSMSPDMEILAKALLSAEQEIPKLLEPTQERAWRGVYSELKNPDSGAIQAQERLARNFRFEGRLYVLNLHHSQAKEADEGKFLSPADTAVHFHPFGNMAVSLRQGAYYMGLGHGNAGTPELAPCWGLVNQGDRYFMAANLCHGLLGITKECYSIMLHEKQPTTAYGDGDFTGITPLPPSRVKELISAFRENLALSR